MPSKVQLTGGSFQDSEGNLLSNGTLVMQLNQDESVTGVGQICSGIAITIQLDVNGAVVTSPAQSVWGNNYMSPANSYYRVTGYSAEGQIAWGPNNQQVAGSGGTFDVGTWVPNQVISWQPPLQSTEIQINGTDVTDQSPINFESAGQTVAITNPSAGIVNFEASSPDPFSVLGNFHYVSAGSTNAFAPVGMNPSTSGAAIQSPTATEGALLLTSVALGSRWTETADCISSGSMKSFVARASMAQITSVHNYIGVVPHTNYNDLLAATSPLVLNFPVILFRYCSDTDGTTIHCVCSTDNTHVTVVDSGVTVDTNLHVYKIVLSVSGTVATFFIDGTQVAQISTNLPTATTTLAPILSSIDPTFNTATQSFAIAYLGWQNNQ